MFEGCERLLETMGQGRSVHAARLELSQAESETRRRVEALKPGAAALCTFELEQVAQAAQRADGFLDRLSVDTAGAFRAEVMDAVRWSDRAQAEAAVAVGPSGLSMVNLACHEGEGQVWFVERLLETAGRMTQEAPSAAERQAWSSLAVLAQRQPAPLEGLLEAAQAVVTAATARAEWTSWPALNELLRAAWQRAPVDDLTAGVRRDLETIRQSVVEDGPPSPALRPILSRLDRLCGLLDRLLAALPASVEQGPAAVSATTRRMSEVLWDIGEARRHLEERAGRDRRVMAVTIEHIVSVAQAFLDGDGSADALAEAIVEFTARIEEARSQVQAHPEGLNAALFEQGLHSLRQAMAQWSLVLSGNREALQTGLDHAYDGIARLIDSQS
ncbi:MAG TPA: hypothetical protein VGO93_05395 [Candidatus Xenobia bacterium]